MALRVFASGAGPRFLFYVAPFEQAEDPDAHESHQHGGGEPAEDDD
jgi:hypothetical protein